RLYSIRDMYQVVSGRATRQNPQPLHYAARVSAMGKRLLVVEDDPAISRLLHDNLVYEGFQVECAADATQALKKVGVFFPDLVLLDLMLPGRSGFEICEEMSRRAHPPGIIVLTAKREDADKVRAFNLGADDYVTKPFTLDELLARVNAVLRRSQPE